MYVQIALRLRVDLVPRGEVVHRVEEQHGGHVDALFVVFDAEDV